MNGTKLLDIDSVEDAMGAFNGDINAFNAAISAEELSIKKATSGLARAIEASDAYLAEFKASLSAEDLASLEKFCSDENRLVTCYKVLTTPVTYVPQTKDDLRGPPEVDKWLVDCRKVNGEYVPATFNGESRT